MAVPSQDMVLGIYYLTQIRGEDENGVPIKGDNGMSLKISDEDLPQYVKGAYKDVNEALLAYENGAIKLQTPIRVRVEKKRPDGTIAQGTIVSTLGRCLFNEIIPQDLGFVDRSVPENELVLEINHLVKKKDLKKILERVINVHGATRTAEVLDKVKAIGYKYSTRAAMTVSISDMTVPSRKQEMLDEAQAFVDRVIAEYNRGRLTDDERYRAVVEQWDATDKELTNVLINGLDTYNNIFMMADSGARGSNEQIKQLAGMRGLMANTLGKTIELPIKSNFREGLDVMEYFMSAHGARKGLSDTALRTADSGYLTRRMVDVSQELIIREKDCSEGRS